jgi:class 3 adenylate cyclase
MLTGYLRLGSVDESRLERVALVWPPRHRLLATVLFTDIVDSTKQAAEIGDWKWGELLQQHQVIVRRELARFPGREVNTAGDGFLIAFDGPGRAIRRGLSISRQVRSLGIDTVSRPFSKCLERSCACQRILD